MGLHHDGSTFLSLASGTSGPVDNSVTLADLDRDGRPEILWGNSESAVFHVGRWTGSVYEDVWTEPINATLDAPEAVGDVDGLPDILVATDGTAVTVYSGLDASSVLYSHTFAEDIDHDHQPVVADLNGDGVNDVFTVYGRGYYDTMEQNWGKAAALPLGGSGPGWPTFSHDHHHSGNFHYPPGELVNTLVFADGFESGDTKRWIVSAP